MKSCKSVGSTVQSVGSTGDLRQRPRALTAALRLAALRQQPAYLHVLVAAPVFESKVDAKVS